MVLAFIQAERRLLVDALQATPRAGGVAQHDAADEPPLDGAWVALVQGLFLLPHRP